MKNYSVLILLGVAFVLFLIGISIPGIDSPLHIIIVTTAVIIGFIFYLRVFWEVINTHGLSRGERILWVIVMVCLPVIGQLMYTIIHISAASRQSPKPDV